MGFELRVTGFPNIRFNPQLNTNQIIMTNEGNVLFPVFFKLHQLELLIVGGGYVGTEKLEAVLKNSPQAKVTIVAPEIRADIVALAKIHPTVNLVYRKFEDQDLEGKDLVIIGTANRPLNESIHVKAKAAKILTNVADTPDLCDFYLCSTIKKGDLKIGVSTNGKSPTFAKRFRQLLEGILPDSIPQILNNLSAIRDTLKGDFEYKVKKLNEITSNMVKK